MLKEVARGTSEPGPPPRRVSPPGRAIGVSERRACRALGQHRTTQRRAPRPVLAPEHQPHWRLRVIARDWPRYGSRRAWALLRQDDAPAIVASSDPARPPTATRRSRSSAGERGRARRAPRGRQRPSQQPSPRPCSAPRARAVPRCCTARHVQSPRRSHSAGRCLVTAAHRALPDRCGARSSACPSPGP